MEEYVEKKGIELERIFEFQESASIRQERKRFDAVLEYVKTNHVKILCVEKTDRLYRNLFDIGRVSKIIKEQGLEVHLFREGTVLSAEAHSSIRLGHYINAAVATNFNERLGEEVKKGYEQKAKSGYFPYCTPFGYKYNHDTKQIEPEAEKREAIKQAFALYASGNYSLKQLADKMDMDGFRPYAKRYFYQGTLWRLLSNPVYYGDFLYRGEVMRAKPEAVTDFATFQKCQEVFRRRREGERLASSARQKQEAKQRPENMFILRDLLRDEGGGSFTASLRKTVKGTRWVRYAASARIFPEKKFTMSEGPIFNGIDALLSSLSFFQCTEKELEEKSREIFKQEISALNKRKYEVNQEYQKLLVRQERILDLYLDEIIAKDELRKKRFHLDIQTRELKKQK